MSEPTKAGGKHCDHCMGRMIGRDCPGIAPEPCGECERLRVTSENWRRASERAERIVGQMHARLARVEEAARTLMDRSTDLFVAMFSRDLRDKGPYALRRLIHDLSHEMADAVKALRSVLDEVPARGRSGVGGVVQVNLAMPKTLYDEMTGGDATDAPVRDSLRGASVTSVPPDSTSGGAAPDPAAWLRERARLYAYRSDKRLVLEAAASAWKAEFGGKEGR